MKRGHVDNSQEEGGGGGGGGGRMFFESWGKADPLLELKMTYP